jgi:sulfur-oxidizing protein SoxX
MMQMTRVVLAGLAAATVVAGCASGGMSQDLDAEFAAMMKSSFRDEGIAKTDRLQQDLAQAACSSPKPPAPEVAKRIEAEAMATIKWPTGGQYFGN